jgi:hypothetical protein
VVVGEIIELGSRVASRGAGVSVKAGEVLGM